MNIRVRSKDSLYKHMTSKDGNTANRHIEQLEYLF